MGLVIAFAPLPQSIFGMLPGAMTADCAAYDEHVTGNDSAAMYFAVNGFVLKLGGRLAALIFTSFLLLGKDVGDHLNIRLVTLCAVVLCGAGLLALRRNDESRILSCYRKEPKDS